MGRSKYDGLASNIASEILNKWVGDQSKKVSSIFLNKVRKDLEFDVHARLFIVTDKKIGFEVLDTTGADGRDFDDDDT